MSCLPEMSVSLKRKYLSSVLLGKLYNLMNFYELTVKVRNLAIPMN